MKIMNFHYCYFVTCFSRVVVPKHDKHMLNKMIAYTVLFKESVEIYKKKYNSTNKYLLINQSIEMYGVCIYIYTT